jgi:hypothetical protein
MGRRKSEVVTVKERARLERRPTCAIEPHNPKAHVRMLAKGTRVTFEGHPILGSTDIGTVIVWHRDRVSVQLVESSWIAAGCRVVEVIPERLKEVK